MRGITNAQQKNGVTTINTIAPDANNDFTIEAGTNVTITPGTNKITISSSGGGGSNSNFTWKFLSDWSGYVSNGKLTEDVVIIYTLAMAGITMRYSIFIPQDTTVGNDRIFSLGSKGNGHILAFSLGAAFSVDGSLNIFEYDDTALITTSTVAKNYNFFLYTRS